jgi:hypothetical protein
MPFSSKTRVVDFGNRALHTKVKQGFRSAALHPQMMAVNKA